MDLLCACPPDAAGFDAKWRQADVARRLNPIIARALHQAGCKGQKLPRANRFATRWCVLASPALDGPRRALLCGVDDSRNMADAVIAAQEQANASA